MGGGDNSDSNTLHQDPSIKALAWTICELNQGVDNNGNIVHRQIRLKLTAGSSGSGSGSSSCGDNNNSGPPVRPVEAMDAKLLQLNIDNSDNDDDSSDNSHNSLDQENNNSNLASAKKSDLLQSKKGKEKWKKVKVFIILIRIG